MVEEALLEAITQVDADVRFDWGPAAARYVHDDAGALVVVDTLSFTTAVSVATRRGMSVIPHALAVPGAAELAAAHRAELAVPRREMSPAHPWSLSPVSLAEAPFTSRLVLPSPNGSAIAAAVVTAAARTGSTPVVVAACLRNVAASAAWLISRGFGGPGRAVTVIAAGERWPDGSLRPALEDLLAAGALLDHLSLHGCRLSIEAQLAAACYPGLPDPVAALRDSASGRELAAMGFGAEIDLAAAVDADGHASVLRDGMFVRDE